MISIRRALLMSAIVSCGPAATRAPDPASNQAPPPAKRSAATVSPIEGDQNTGFDLYVDPPGARIENWMLDGEPITGRLPSRVRGISPGRHTIDVEAPGFDSRRAEVVVELGTSEKVVVTLPVCDEVYCVTKDYAPACCAKFNRPRPSKNQLPFALDAALIANGTASVRASIAACGENTQAKGVVKVSVKVNPDGGIASITIKQTPDPALGKCVADAMKAATFEQTQTGGLFSQPYVF